MSNGSMNRLAMRVVKKSTLPRKGLASNGYMPERRKMSVNDMQPLFWCGTNIPPDLEAVSVNKVVKSSVLRIGIRRVH